MPTTVTAELRGGSVFATLDPVKGYDQVPIAEQDTPQTAVMTPFRLYEYTRVVSGLDILTVRHRV